MDLSLRALQLASLVGLAIIGLFLQPWLRRAPRAPVLIALLAVHVARVQVLFAIPAQAAGYPISNHGLIEAVGGDLLGAALAAAGIVALRRGSMVGITLSWLVVIETLLDFGVVIHRRIVEPLTVAPTGPLLFVLAFFAPLCLVTLPLMISQLVSRRGEPLASSSHAKVVAS